MMLSSTGNSRVFGLEGSCIESTNADMLDVVSKFSAVDSIASKYSVPMTAPRVLSPQFEPQPIVLMINAGRTSPS